jgi:hypothetical protein
MAFSSALSKHKAWRFTLSTRICVCLRQSCVVKLFLTHSSFISSHSVAPSRVVFFLLGGEIFGCLLVLCFSSSTVELPPPPPHHQLAHLLFISLSISAPPPSCPLPVPAEPPLNSLALLDTEGFDRFHRFLTLGSLFAPLEEYLAHFRFASLHFRASGRAYDSRHLFGGFESSR